jgi:hypothetical protein
MSISIPYKDLQKIVTAGKKVVMTDHDGKDFSGTVLELDMDLTIPVVIIKWENGNEMTLPGFYFSEDNEVLRIRYSHRLVYSDCGARQRQQ